MSDSAIGIVLRIMIVVVALAAAYVSDRRLRWFDANSLARTLSSLAFTIAGVIPFAVAVTGQSWLFLLVIPAAAWVFIPIDVIGRLGMISNRGRVRIESGHLRKLSKEDPSKVGSRVLAILDELDRQAEPETAEFVELVREAYELWMRGESPTQGRAEYLDRRIKELGAQFGG